MANTEEILVRGFKRIIDGLSEIHEDLQTLNMLLGKSEADLQALRDIGTITETAVLEIKQKGIGQHDKQLG